MFNIEYILDSDPDGVTTEGQLLITVNSKKLTLEIGQTTHPNWLIYYTFETLLHIVKQKYFWNSEGWTDYILDSDSSFCKLTINNYNTDTIVISCTVNHGTSDVLVEKGQTFKVLKQEFFDEVIRIIGKLIDELQWRDDEVLQCTTEKEAVRNFVEKYDSLADQNR